MGGFESLTLTFDNGSGTVNVTVPDATDAYPDALYPAGNNGRVIHAYLFTPAGGRLWTAAPRSAARRPLQPQSHLRRPANAGVADPHAHQPGVTLSDAHQPGVADSHADHSGVTLSDTHRSGVADADGPGVAGSVGRHRRCGGDDATCRSPVRR